MDQASGPAGGESALKLDAEKIRDLQQRLSALGYDPRGVDGRLGPGTRGALRAFQRAHDLPETGYFSADALRAIREPH